MNKFEIIAEWIHSSSDEPISEIEWLLKSKYSSESKLLKVYGDVISHIKEREKL